MKDRYVLPAMLLTDTSILFVVSGWHQFVAMILANCAIGVFASGVEHMEKS